MWPRNLILLTVLVVFAGGVSGRIVKRRVKRAMIWKPALTWEKGIVPYEISLEMTDAERANLTAAMNAWSRETCVTFRPKRDSDRNYIRVVDGNRCHSLVGRHPDPIAQELILQTRCRMYGVILHELGHALGLLHEHNRPDRNEHIIVDQSRSFNRMEESEDVLLYQTPYDLQSIMHYGVGEFPNNEVPTIKNNAKKELVGNVYHKELSFFDVRAINLHYRCNAHCEQKNCPGVAFQNKTCQCEGPEDYADRRCFNLRGDEECNARADRNHCDLYPVDMRHHCRKACNTCFKHAGHGVHVRKKVCKDHDASCPGWASSGECERNPAWMKNSCPRSCGQCTPSAEQLAEERSSTTLTTARPCVNVKTERECRSWKRSGNCGVRRYRRFMMRNCYKTCSGCIDPNAPSTTAAPCVNVASDSDCASWRSDGYCHSHQYHEWMQEQCARTCAFCTAPSTSTVAPTTARRAPAAGQPACTDSNANCASWASSGECSANPTWMGQNCRKSCGTCPGTCADSDSRCPQWASRGECSRNEVYMNTNCRRSCDQCSE